MTSVFLQIGYEKELHVIIFSGEQKKRDHKGNCTRGVLAASHLQDWLYLYVPVSNSTGDFLSHTRTQVRTNWEMGTNGVTKCDQHVRKYARVSCVCVCVCVCVFLRYLVYKHVHYIH